MVLSVRLTRNVVSGRHEPNTAPPSENWRYANFFQAALTEQEVIIDFGQHFEGSAGPYWHTRIVLSPHSAHELLAVLERVLADSQGSITRFP
jgi:hypothetical protein